jgi:hypothetical protein
MERSLIRKWSHAYALVGHHYWGGGVFDYWGVSSDCRQVRVLLFREDLAAVFGWRACLLCCGSVSDACCFSAILAILGFTMLWSIGELKHQAKRMEKGWFPKNPYRAKGKQLERKGVRGETR